MTILEHIKKLALNLTPEERQALARYLAEPANQEPSPQKLQTLHGNNGDDEIRQRRLEWLKSHREEHGGQYVALDGDQLLAVGPNYRIAREKAQAAGKPNAFVTYLSKPDEIPEMGGWA